MWCHLPKSSPIIIVYCSQISCSIPQIDTFQCGLYQQSHIVKEQSCNVELQNLIFPRFYVGCFPNNSRCLCNRVCGNVENVFPLNMAGQELPHIRLHYQPHL